MGAVLIVALVVLAWWCLAGGGSARAPGGHVHSGTRSRVARHEAGHVVAARGLGSRVRSANIYPDGSGFVGWTGTTGTDYQQVVNAVAFLRAGEYAAGTGEGCGGDKDQVRRELRYLPTTERAAALRDGERAARRIVSSRSGEIGRVARRLNERGRL